MTTPVLRAYFLVRRQRTRPAVSAGQRGGRASDARESSTPLGKSPNETSRVSAENALSPDGAGLPARPRRLVRRDLVVVTERDADVVETLEQPPPGVVVDVEGV